MIGEPLDGLPWLPWALFGLATVAALLDAQPPTGDA